MNKNCRFKSSYNKKLGTYSASFRGLTKEQLNALRSIFRSLSPVGVVLTYEGGFTLPMYELRCSVPLSRCAGNTMSLPNSVLHDIVLLFNNGDIPIRDVIVTPTGELLNRFV